MQREGLGIGRICSIEHIELDVLAQRCNDAFKTRSRVWGVGNTSISQIATCSGSAGGSDISAACINNGVDCLICGEIGYHDALSLAEAGVNIVELGHDASELPFSQTLAACAVDAGVAKDNVFILDQTNN